MKLFSTWVVSIFDRAPEGSVLRRTTAGLLLGIPLLLAGTGEAEPRGKDAESSPVFPRAGASLEETLASASRRRTELTNVVVKQVQVLRTDTEPWQVVPLDALRSGAYVAPDGADYAVVSVRACRAVVKFHWYRATRTAWYLLPGGRLAAWEHHRFEDTCLTFLSFEAPTGKLAEVEEALSERLGLDRSLGASPLDAYKKGVAYARAWRTAAARRMLEAGDAAFDAYVPRDLRERSRREQIDVADVDDRDELRAALVQVIESFEEVEGSEEPSPAALLTAARVHADALELDAAEKKVEQAVEIVQAENGDEDVDLSGPLLALGQLQAAQGHTPVARDLLEQALEVQRQSLPEAHALVAVTLGSLASTELDAEDLQAAREHTLRAYAIGAETLESDDPTWAKLLHLRAIIHYVDGELAEAERLLRQALRIYRGSKYRRGEMEVEYSLGSVQVARGAHADAKWTLGRLLEREERVLGATHPALAVTLGQLAFLAAIEGDVERYAEYQRRSNRIANLFTESLLSHGIERQWAWTLSEQDRQTFASVFFSLRSDDPRAHLVALETVLQRKGRLLDTVRMRLQQARRDSSFGTAYLLDQLASVRADLASLAFSPPPSMDEQQLAGEAARLQTVADTFEAELSERVDLAALRQEVGVEDVRARLPEDGALVEFVAYRPFEPERVEASYFERWGEPRYGACVLRPGAEPRCLDLGPAEAVDAAVADLLAALAQPARDPRRAARAAYALFFAPLEPLLGDARFVIVSPDQDLNVVPFGALVADDGRYLLERYTFDYVSSGRSLARAARAGGGAGGVAIVVGDPDFDGREPAGAAGSGRNRPTAAPRAGLSQHSFQALPGTRAEAIDVASLLPGSVALLGEQASESAVKRLHSPTILHIATHGFLEEAEPPATPEETALARARAISLGVHGSSSDDPMLRSGLVFAGFNRRRSLRDDGALTALEASALDLADTELVVLSACQTGLGEVVSGEGVYGLRRAFEVAGADSQVTSLWNVADASTAELMVRYYERLVDGVPRAAALRAARLELSRTHPHPFYWAAFVPSGDWDELRLPEPSDPALTLGAPYMGPPVSSAPPLVVPPRVEFEITELGLEVAERGDEVWTFGWAVTIRNRGERSVTLDAKVELLDADENVLKVADASGLVVGAGEQKTFRGEEPVASEAAGLVGSARANLELVEVHEPPPERAPRPSPPARR